jgi:DNA sulfur modification protein DndD
MIIKKITLRNFGPFLGVHSLDLNTLPDKPLILVGALNGGGKTSILEATRLTLYGSECGNGKLRSMKYKEYLRMCMNNSAPKGSITSTELTFSRNEEGVTKEIRVDRAWSLRGDSVDETISVFINGELEEALSNDAGWNSYMSACLPAKLAHLFLFDGEQILHGGAGGVSPILKDGVYSLLGIETIDKLTNDLELFERKQLTELINKSALTELKSFESEIQAISTKLQSLKGDRKAQEELLRSSEELLSRRKAEFAKNGGDEYKDQEHTKGKLKLKEAELEAVNNELIEVFSGPLNLEITLNQLKHLQKRAKDESEAQIASASIELLLKRDKAFAKEVVDKLESATKEKIVAWLSRDIEKRRASILGIPKLGLEDGISENIKMLTEHTIPQLRIKADSLIKHQSKVEDEISALKEKLSQVPTSEYIQEQESLLNQATLDMQMVSAGLFTLDTNIDHHEKAFLEKESALRAFKLANIDAASNGAEAIRLQRQTAKSLATLAEFKKKLISENISLIQSLIEESLQRLLRKLSLIKKLTIDPETFEIHLESPAGATVLWQQMSAGEQQIVTTAIIWGLARASGHVFPMMVDTPLGRLDESHRGKLLEHYYPEASHQVVLLSTDKEIGPRDLESLKDHVTRTYLVRHNEETKVSDLSEGYFN